MKFESPENEEIVSTPDVLSVESLQSSFRELMHEFMIFNIKILRKEGLAMSQLVILKHLYFDRPEYLSSIAMSLGISKPTVTGIIDTLEKDGFVLRKRDKRDRRGVAIVLTQKAIDLFKRVEDNGKFAIDDLFKSIPEDYIEPLNKTMLGLVEKFREINKKYRSLKS